MSVAGRRCASSVEARRKKRGIADADAVTVVAAASCRGREEEVGLARRGRGNGAALRSTHAAPVRIQRRRRLLIRVLVELRGRSGEAGLVVRDMLSVGSTSDGAVQEASDNAAPDEDTKTESTQDGTNGDEDGSLRSA